MRSETPLSSAKGKCPLSGFANVSGAVVQSYAVQVSWTSGTNVAPLVNAGEDVTVTMPEGTGLSGTGPMTGCLPRC